MMRHSTIPWLLGLLSACGSNTVPLSDAPGAGGNGAGGSGGQANGNEVITQRSSDVDLLLVIDNSISMADKQKALASSLGELVQRLINPRCVDGAGKPVAQPGTPSLACPAGSQREHAPVASLNVGVVTTALGGRGGETCSSGQEGQDDRARLLGSVRAVTSSNAHGYLEWPGGDSSVDGFISLVRSHVIAAGEIGCGYEAPLEAMYRFLVSPDPPAEVVKSGAFTVQVGLDETLLTQRGAFLRPGSTLGVLLLTDENDCSIAESGQGWLVSTVNSGLPKATPACETNPDAAGCKSCGVPGSGCEGENHAAMDDHVNLRCWEQKRRFGVDFLHPIERYVRGFSSPTVVDRDGHEVPNPLFALQSGKKRAPDQIVVAGLVGVPWHLLARPGTHAPGTPLALRTAAELAADGVWPAITGSYQAPPTDPHMLESPFPRGSLPTWLTPHADPIHGHETDGVTAGAVNGPGDLQYACTFPIEPRDCTLVAGGCECTNHGINAKSPLCFDGAEYSSVQRYAKAYPGRRQLDLLRALGSRAAVGSVCPKTLSGSPRDVGYGYNPLFDNLLARLGKSLE
ncbi:MAG: hypothetical protein KF718_01205 [Polyangiaceae bacterium]|nr:hypothetical protein [Polyangiaceae bacterium]